MRTSAPTIRRHAWSPPRLHDQRQQRTHRRSVRLLDARLPPVMNGVPSALQFSGGASLAPGRLLAEVCRGRGRSGRHESSTQFHAGLSSMPAAADERPDGRRAGRREHRAVAADSRLQGGVRIGARLRRGLRQRRGGRSPPPTRSRQRAWRGAGVREVAGAKRGRRASDLHPRCCRSVNCRPDATRLRVTLTSEVHRQDADARLRSGGAGGADDVGRRRRRLRRRTSILPVTDAMLARPFDRRRRRTGRRLQVFRARVAADSANGIRQGRRLPGSRRLRQGGSELQDRHRSRQRQHRGPRLPGGRLRSGGARRSRRPARGRPR